MVGTPRAGSPANATGGEPRGGTAATLEELYREHADSMYRVAVSIVRDHALAEDVVQEAVVKAWRYLDTFRGDAALRTWVLRITHNEAVSMLRRLRDVAVDPTEIPESHTPELESEAMRDAFIAAFEDALFELDETSRAIVALRELEELPYEEIGRVLGVSDAVVKTRLYRARHSLADRLSGWRP